jgi:hypothetical protein
VVRRGLRIEQEVFAVPGLEQVDVPDSQLLRLPIKPNAAGSRVKQHQLEITLDTRAAIPAGLVTDLTERGLF